MEKIFKKSDESVDRLPDSCCENCRFSSKFEDLQSSRKILNCCFNPPTVSFAFIMDQNGVQNWPSVSGWPVVAPHQWCGKFRAKLNS